MSRLSAFNLKAWIDEHRHLLKPPVGNALMWNEGFQVMIVGGPNRRNDYHVDPGEELFYQIEGDMTLRIIEDGKPRDMPIREGEIFLLPPLVPHSPQRPENTVGMVVERVRTPEEQDRFQWYCDKCGAIVHDTALRVTDLAKQIKPILEDFYADESLRTCKKCGEVMQPPAPSRAG